MSDVIVGAIQMCSTPDVNENFIIVDQLLKEACDKGAKLVVLPEMFCMFGVANDLKLAIAEEYGLGEMQTRLANFAQKYKIWIVAGTIPIKSKTIDKCRAASLVFDDSGDIVGRYDKNYLFDVKLSEHEWHLESACVEAGDNISIIDSPFGKLSIVVCYDLRFPELFVKLRQHDIELLAVPTAFTRTTGLSHWDILSKSRALDTVAYCIYSCQAGNHANSRYTYGHSRIINPWGKLIDEIPEIAGVVTATIDYEYMASVKSTFRVNI